MKCFSLEDSQLHSVHDTQYFLYWTSSSSYFWFQGSLLDTDCK